MLNPQLLNNLGDFFATFKEIVTLATNPQQLDTIIAGLSDAKDTLAKADAAKPALAALEDFKTSKESQLKEISDAKEAADEAARLNTEHATALTETSEQLAAQIDEHKHNVSALAEETAAVKAREQAVALAEQAAKDTQAKADQALEAANDLKQAYVTKLQTIAAAEGAPDGSTSQK